MDDWQSLSHVRWDCKYHVVIVPKYRKKVVYGKLKYRAGPILRQLCQQRGVELLEGHAMPDHIHMCLSVPPKFSVARTIGFLKGKSAVQIHRKLLHERSDCLENQVVFGFHDSFFASMLLRIVSSFLIQATTAVILPFPFVRRR